MKKIWRKSPYVLSLILSSLFVGLFCGIPKVILWVQMDGEKAVLWNFSKSGEQIDTDEIVEGEAIEESEPEESNIVLGETESAEEHVWPTHFFYYNPIETHSKYYTDPGRRPFTTDFPKSTVDVDYFDDAAFIGDSRMMGIYDYAGIEQADFYCNDGFCTYLWDLKKTVVYQNEKQKLLLEDAFSQKQYGKIYIMLGMNDCGYGDTQNFKDRYSRMLTMLREKQPDAVLYLLGIMNISEKKSESDAVFNNVHINDKNVAIAECADGIHSFYLDYNELYVDENRFLRPDITYDGIHLYAAAYKQVREFLLTHAYIK